MRVNVYVDGFNLYYGCVQGTTERWLDLGSLCSKLMPFDTINRIRYFTALVTSRSHDPLKLQRQQTYIRALETISALTVHYGKFQTTKVERELVSTPTGVPTTVRVFDTKEKGSDVNLATYLLVDGFRNDYEKAVVISNDADLCEPIKMVKTDLKLPILVVCPTLNGRRHPSRELRKVATSIIVFRRHVLKSSQFPIVLADANGLITKPTGW